MIFDININNFKKKDRYVSGGHTMEPPSSIIYARIFSRKIVSVALTMASFKNLFVFTNDVQNAYLKSPVTKKIWTTCGPEFGSDSGKRTIIFVRSTV